MIHLCALNHNASILLQVLCASCMSSLHPSCAQRTQRIINKGCSKLGLSFASPHVRRPSNDAQNTTCDDDQWCRQFVGVDEGKADHADAHRRVHKGRVVQRLEAKGRTSREDQPGGRRIEAGERPAVDGRLPQLLPERQQTEYQYHTGREQTEPAEECAREFADEPPKVRREVEKRPGEGLRYRQTGQEFLLADPRASSLSDGGLYDGVAHRLSIDR
mmetsp:Transcript_21061/g.51338  ORF Transcript_21061/g.51338 Transcript_21061/m.51338 type:complete len:217 (+) Transcript_21061:1447-2097(+)